MAPGIERCLLTARQNDENNDRILKLLYECVAEDHFLGFPDNLDLDGEPVPDRQRVRVGTIAGAGVQPRRQAGRQEAQRAATVSEDGDRDHEIGDA